MLRTWQLEAGLGSWRVIVAGKTHQMVPATPIYNKNVIGREQR